MTSLENYFGQKAGVVWRALKEHGPLTVGVLKRRTKLSTSEVYAALGWLAKENKISIQGEKPLQYKYAVNG